MQQNNQFITSALRVLIPILDLDAKRPEPNRMIIIRRLVHQAQKDQIHPFQGSIGKVLYQDELNRIKQLYQGQSNYTPAINKAHLFMTQDFHGDFKTLQDKRLTIVTISQSADSIKSQFKKIAFDQISMGQNIDLSYRGYLSRQEEKEFNIKDKGEFVNFFMYTLALFPALQQLFRTALSPFTAEIKTTDTLEGKITAEKHQNFNIYDYDQELKVSIDDSIRAEVIRQIAFLKKFLHSLIDGKRNSALTDELTFEFLKFIDTGIPNYLADFDKDFHRYSEAIQRGIIKEVSEWQLMLIDLSTQIDALKFQQRLRGPELESALEVLMILRNCSIDNEEDQTGFAMIMGNSKLFPKVLSPIFVKYASLEISPQGIAVRKSLTNLYKLNFQPIAVDIYEKHIQAAKKIMEGDKNENGIAMTDLKEVGKMSEAIKLLESKIQGKRVSAQPITNPILTEHPSVSFLINVHSNPRKNLIKPLPLLPPQEIKNLEKELKELKGRLTSVTAKIEVHRQYNDNIKSMLLSKVHVPMLIGDSRELPMVTTRCKQAVGFASKQDGEILRLTEQEESLNTQIRDKAARLQALKKLVENNTSQIRCSSS